MMADMGTTTRRRSVSRLFITGLVAMLAPGCGRISGHFSGHTVTRKGTVSAVPSTGAAGTAFSLRAAGLKPGESMTFEIDPPKGRPFIGPPHTAGPDGTVTSTYTPQPADPPGTYKLMATGAQGTRATSSLTVAPTAGRRP
jgi:hypothetical protein